MKEILDSSFLKIRLSHLYVLNIGVNISGLLIIALLNLFTPLEFFKIQRAFLLAGGWLTIISFYPKGSICQTIRSNPGATARDVLTSCYHALNGFWVIAHSKMMSHWW